MKYTSRYFDIEVPDEELKQMNEFNCRTRVIEIATRELANVSDLDIQKVREFLDLISQYVVKEIQIPTKNGVNTTYKTVRDYVKNKDIEKEVLAKAEEVQMNNRNFKSDVLEKLGDLKVSEWLENLKDMSFFVSKDSIDSLVNWAYMFSKDIKNTLKVGKTTKTDLDGLQLQFDSTVKGCGKSTFISNIVSAAKQLNIPAEDEVPLPENNFEDPKLLAISKCLVAGFMERQNEDKPSKKILMHIGRREPFSYKQKNIPTQSFQTNAITLGSSNGYSYIPDDRSMRVIQCLPLKFTDFPENIQKNAKQVTSYGVRVYQCPTTKFLGFLGFWTNYTIENNKNNVTCGEKVQKVKKSRDLIEVVKKLPNPYLLLTVLEEIAKTFRENLSRVSVANLSKLYKTCTGNSLTFVQQNSISESLNRLFAQGYLKKLNYESKDMYKQFDLFELSYITVDDLSDETSITVWDELQEAQDYWDKMIEAAKIWESENPDPTDPTKIDREEKELNDTATATATATEPTEPSGPSGKTTEGNELASNRGGDEGAEATDTANDTTFEPGISAPAKPEVTIEAAKELEKQLPDIPPVFYKPLEPEAKADAKADAKAEANTLEMINDNYELQAIFSAICADVNGTLTEEQKDTLSLKPKKVSEEKHLLTQQEMDEVKNYFDEICGISKPTEPSVPTEPSEPSEPTETPNLQKTEIVKTEYEYPEGFDLSQKKLTKEDVEKFDIQVVSEATNKTGHLEPLATDQFIVAARLKDKSQGLVRRTDLMEPVFFVYESDSLSLSEQQRILGPMRTIPSIFSMTYSGSKSIHTLVYIDPKDRDIVSQDYKFFWKTIGEELFGENAKYLDPACASIVRLTRLPGGFRYDTGKDQKCLYINRKCRGVNIVKANAKYQQKLLDTKRRQEETARKLEAFKLSGREPGNPDGVKHLENLFKKTNDPRAEIALTLINGGDPGSGANYIGAIGYVNTAIGPETAEKVRQAAHQLHPSNITKIA